MTAAKMSTVKAPTGFIKVTRLYSKSKVYTKNVSKVGKQTNLIAVAQIESFRARKKIAGASATIITTSGAYINTLESVKDIAKMVNAVYASLE